MGGALNFDGTDDYISYLISFPQQQGTISHWLKPKIISGRMIAAYQATGSTSPLDGFGYIVSGYLEIHTCTYYDQFCFFYQDGTAYSGIYSGGSAYPDIWTHVVATWDRANNMKMYFNGIESASNSIAGLVFENLSPTYSAIGRAKSSSGNGANRFWNGSIDDMRISSTARTAEWIKFEYNNMNESDNELSFALQQHAPAPTPTNLTATPSLNTMSISVDQLPNDTIAQSGYYFESSTGNN